jgi:hypothetical protein
MRAPVTLAPALAAAVAAQPVTDGVPAGQFGLVGQVAFGLGDRLVGDSDAGLAPGGAERRR